MSKYVKDLVTKHLSDKLDGVSDMLLVSVMGLSANATSALRKELRGKNIELLMVKTSLARRATEGTALAPAFEGSQGSLAMVWGASDIVALAKEIVRLSEDKQFAPFEPKGGVMSGSKLTAAEVKDVSKWPSREEQLSLLLGQILSPGAVLCGQLTAVGGALASQIKQIADKEGDAPAEEAPAADAATATA